MRKIDCKEHIELKNLINKILKMNKWTAQKIVNSRKQS